MLSRAPVGEASSFITLITSDLGLVRALAQSVRKSGAKLSPALASFAESDVTLVRGKDGWRLSGAVLEECWFARLGNIAPRERAARLSGLLLRLVAGESQNAELFHIMRGAFDAFAKANDKEHEAIESLAALRILSALGLVAGAIPGSASEFDDRLLAEVAENRSSYIERINRGIVASGL